mmetsp:Transcript_22851/g.69943  ORF Transcript_22851/g.69943 Transcript_22851/m.69943 type:complete len:344 (+) Transcript_22851:1119-2150(+)
MAEFIASAVLRGASASCAGFTEGAVVLAASPVAASFVAAAAPAPALGTGLSPSSVSSPKLIAAIAKSSSSPTSLPSAATPAAAAAAAAAAFAASLCNPPRVAAAASLAAAVAAAAAAAAAREAATEDEVPPKARCALSGVTRLWNPDPPSPRINGEDEAASGRPPKPSSLSAGTVEPRAGGPSVSSKTSGPSASASGPSDGVSRMFFTEPAAAGAALARAEPLKAGDGATAGAPDAAGVAVGAGVADTLLYGRLAEGVRGGTPEGVPAPGVAPGVTADDAIDPGVAGVNGVALGVGFAGVPAGVLGTGISGIGGSGGNIRTGSGCAAEPGAPLSGSVFLGCCR